MILFAGPSNSQSSIAIQGIKKNWTLDQAHFRSYVEKPEILGMNHQIEKSKAFFFITDTE